MNKKRVDYSKKYGSSLKHSPDTEQGDLLIQGKNNALKKISPLEVKYNGSTYKLILDLYHDLQDDMSLFKLNTNNSLDYLASTLKDNGYNTSNIELNALIEDIYKLDIIRPTKEYTHVTFKDGYVNGVEDYGVLIPKGDIPEDYANGYWTIVDKKWVLDKEKYEQYWGQL